ncbi:hypothetical protein [Tenacibaculum agarivorans]|uniref:hypothetical protein n=1 Tax=Tenacibaculum agarivorans TaxID=1908389 RepID=UPI00094BC38C|nr:hypothetical protein [Tenacibaculum agarivorans]
MELLKKYNLEINSNEHIVTKDSNKQILVHFLAYWDNVQDIKEDLLPELNLVINKELKFNDIGADVVGVAYIESETTKLLGSDLGHSDFELPTKDFKELIMLWIYILEENGR